MESMWVRMFSTVAALLTISSFAIIIMCGSSIEHKIIAHAQTLRSIQAVQNIAHGYFVNNDDRLQIRQNAGCKNFKMILNTVSGVAKI